VRTRTIFPNVPLACIALLSACRQDSKKASQHFTDPKVQAVAEALEANDFASAEKLLPGIDVNTVGNKGITLPKWCMLSNNQAAFKWLFEHAANPNLIPPGDRGILLWACRSDDAG